MRMFFLALVVAMGGVSEAWAHRVNLFAYVDGGRIVTESWFSKSSRVREGLIEVFDAATGEKLLSGTTDDQGNFAFDIPPAARQRKADLRITLKAGEGHGNETMVKAGEYLNSPAAIAPASPVPTASPGAPDAPGAPAAGNVVVSPPPSAASPEPSAMPAATGTPVPPPAASSAPVSPDPALLAAMDRMLDAKLAPVKSMLAESLDPAPSMTEILGGIGWIFGLMGVAAYFKSRKG
ncbi:hypothetical protein ASZ90_003006 [hydrocarbon metagenome]|uniref:Nickel transport protein n=1 Tax=hydrocarbon metagenome TaxID=938273 RepID=A0A0W8G1Y0_9ZZZZ